MLLTLSIALGTATISTWTLEGEYSGFFNSRVTLYYYEGPATFQVPNAPTIPLYYLEYQDKGDESWDVPWSEDLEELDFGSTNWVIGGLTGGTGTIESGDWERLSIVIRTDVHEQVWRSFSNLSALRKGYWDNFSSLEYTSGSLEEDK